MLSEFDFLHDIEHPHLVQRPTEQPPPPPISSAQEPTTPPIPQQRPQIIFTSDVYHRPLLSMPPVILMGGEGTGAILYGGSSSYSLQSSMPSSPIVEMPPSPAPSTLMCVEFPDDEVDEIRIIGVNNIVEVRIDSIFLLNYSTS